MDGDAVGLGKVRGCESLCLGEPLSCPLNISGLPCSSPRMPQLTKLVWSPSLHLLTLKLTSICLR